MINCQFLLPPSFVSRPSSCVPRNSEKLPVAGFRWRMEQGGAPACSIRTGNDRSHSRQAPAGAAIPLAERTTAEGSTTARLRVVSKCALRAWKSGAPR